MDWKGREWDGPERNGEEWLEWIGSGGGDGKRRERNGWIGAYGKGEEQNGTEGL